MTGRNHLLIAGATGAAIAAASGLSWQTGAIPVVLVAVLGGLIPDIDHPQSLISGWIPFTGWILNRGGMSHRTFTHSILFMLILAGLWHILSQQGIITVPWLWMIALLAGIASHITADMVTPEGVRLLYPLPGFVKLSPWNWSIFNFWLLRPFRWMINSSVELLAGAAALVAVIGLSIYLWR